MLVPSTLGLVIGIITLVVIFLYRHFTKLRRYGIPGPTPLPLIGNMMQEISMGTEFTPSMQNKYGSVFGIYRGYHPFVTIMDQDIASKILVKDFSNFMNRPEFIASVPRLLLNGLFFMTGRCWKRTRNIISPIFSGSKLKQVMIDKNIISPIFSGSKLKQMTDLLNRCGCSLGTALEGQIGKTVTVKEILGRFTMDTISSTTFGLDADPQNQHDCPLLKNMVKITRPKKVAVFGIILASVFPPIRPILYYIGLSFWPKDAFDFYEETCKTLLEDRKKTKLNKTDFIQRLLDAEFEAGRMEHVQHGVALASDQQETHRLTDEEIHGNAFVFFFAGYDTTSTTLTFAAHVLSLRPDIDKKLYDEIAAQLGTDEPTYDNIGRLKYMEQFLNEVLRMYPPVARLDRISKEDYPLGNGMVIPKGCRIQIPVFYLHRNEDFYTNPEEFNPDRFSTDQKVLDSVTHIPFGFGPRHCIGMRFAQVVLKMGLVHMLRRVRFTRCEDSQDNVHLRVVGLLQTTTPIKVGLEQRDS